MRVYAGDYAVSHRCINGTEGRKREREREREIGKRTERA